MPRSHPLLPLLGFLVLIHFPQITAAAPVFAYLTPDAATVAAGDVLNVQVRVTGLGAGFAPSVGAYDIDIGYDGALFSLNGVSFSGELGDPDPAAFETFSEFLSSPGAVNIAAVSLLSEIELDLLQSADVLLATLSFDALSNGGGAFALLKTRVDDAFGNKLPTPHGLSLFAAALIAWRLTRMRGPR